MFGQSAPKKEELSEAYRSNRSIDPADEINSVCAIKLTYLTYSSRTEAGRHGGGLLAEVNHRECAGRQ